MILPPEVIVVMMTVPAVNPVLVVAKAATVIVATVPVVFALIGIGMPPPANGPLVTRGAQDAASTNLLKL